MATGEDQPQHVVIECRGRVGFISAESIELDLVAQLVLLLAKSDLPAHAVDRLVASDIDEPGARIGRRIFAGPSFERHRESILQRILGKIEIADEADQRGQRTARLVTEYLFDLARGNGALLIVIPGRPKDEPGMTWVINYKPRSA
jgi:hypothetical protein